MSYRSIKRVLGETSLERKCRLLFGGCLLLLITGTFWGVDRIAGNLVMTNTRNHGHDLIDIIMIKVHSLFFETRPNAVDAENPDIRGKREWLREIIVDFEESQDYRYEIVTLDPNYWLSLDLDNVSPAKPQDEVERRLLTELDEKFKAQKGQLIQEAEAPPAKMTPQQALGEAGEKVMRPVFIDRLPDKGQGEYHYFEPVYFKTTCRLCHNTALDVGTVSATELGHSYAQEPPLLAVKVILPYADTAEAISNSRAILIAVAILTVFMSMIMLYLIVRYVIVKPLKHLRDVSDDDQSRQDGGAGRHPHGRRVRRSGHVLQPHVAAPDRHAGRTAAGERQSGRQGRRAGPGQHAALRNEPAQERLPGQHEPRAAHAAQQHHRLLAKCCRVDRRAQRQAEALRRRTSRSRAGCCWR